VREAERTAAHGVADELAGEQVLVVSPGQAVGGFSSAWGR
jgi:hypothetical protein